MAEIRQEMFKPRPRAEVEEDARKLEDAYKRECPLRMYPGVRTVWFRAFGSGEIVPAYLVATHNARNQVFPMADFVRYDGMNGLPASNNWSHDVLHSLKNNVDANLPNVRKNFSELIDVGKDNSRWRDGVLGRAGVLEGKTVILCAPGPSLAGKAEEIQEYRKRKDVVVMSLNRAMRYVESDYCVFVERWAPESWRDETVFSLQENAALITTPQAHPALISGWRNKDNIYWGRVAMGQFDDDRVTRLKWIDAMASTSAAIAVRCAYEMGARKIVLLGFDYSSKMTVGVRELELSPESERGLFDKYRKAAEAIVDGQGPYAANCAEEAIVEEKRLRENAFSFKWEVQEFYFDQDFSNTEYVNDRRFASWSPVQACDGSMAGTNMELLLYCEQIKAVFGCIESGSDCRIISASPSGILNWGGVQGTKPHEPMQLSEAINW